MKSRHALALLAAVLLLAACTPNGGIIYYVLENEAIQPDTGLGTSGKLLTVQNIVSFNGYFYVAAGKIWSSPVNTSPKSLVWTGVTAPATGALCTAMATFNPGTPTLFAGFIGATGAGIGLYQSTDAAGGFGSPTLVPGVPAAEQVERLIVPPSNDRVLIITAIPAVSETAATFTYNLYSWDGTTLTSLISGSSTLLNDATFDGTNYYAVGGTTVFKGTAAPLGSATTPTLATAGDVLQAITYVPTGTKLLVGTKLNGIFTSSDGGGSWSGLAADVQSSKAVSYITFSSPITAGGGTVFAGSDGYGYYTYDGTSALATTRYVDLTISLYTSNVRRFLLSGGIAFAGTSGAGLWAGAWDSGTGAVTSWTRQ
jgi:hypothetical protein